MSFWKLSLVLHSRKHWYVLHFYMSVLLVWFFWQYCSTVVDIWHGWLVLECTTLRVSTNFHTKRQNSDKSDFLLSETFWCTYGNELDFKNTVALQFHYIAHELPQSSPWIILFIVSALFISCLISSSNYLPPLVSFLTAFSCFSISPSFSTFLIWRWNTM